MSAKNDSRLRNQTDAARSAHPAARADAARVNDEGTELTIEERRKMLQNEFTQEALPNPPKMEGWHLCWLSTTHSYDPIPRRLRLGYELVKQTELPGFDIGKTSSGDYAGYIMCNEMVLAKLPMEIYQMIMEEFHHNQPLREEEAIHAQIQSYSEEDKAGKDLTIRDEGFQEKTLVQRKPVPVFGG